MSQGGYFFDHTLILYICVHTLIINSTKCTSKTAVGLCR